MPEDLLGVTILIFMSKVYVLGLFYSLNARLNNRKENTAISMNEFHRVS